jgi:flagellar hook-basal body complex protein FliE
MAPIAPPQATAAANAYNFNSLTAGVDKAGAGHSVEFPAHVGKANAAPESFGAMVDQFVSGVDGKMQTARAEQAKVLTGETTNLHQAMISMQEASVAFSLMIEVRNKLVESYQEMMRMQV